MRHTIQHSPISTATKNGGGKAPGSAPKTGPSGQPTNPFPGGNWPSKVPGHKSGGNRGQGPK